MFFYRNIPKHASLSYSQCAEDIIVDFIFSNLNQNKRSGKFIDIGAHHPTFLNNTHLFYKKGWKGINIDPIKKNIRFFQKLRPKDTNICAGIGSLSEEIKFYIMDATALSTSDYNVVKHLQSLGHSIKHIEKVRFMTVRELITQQNIDNDIDLLSIDIEGDELSVIKDFISQNICPKIIICETVNYSPILNEATKNNLIIHEIVKLGYFVYADTFINSIFVANKFWGKKEDSEGLLSP